VIAMTLDEDANAIGKEPRSRYGIVNRRVYVGFAG